MQTAEFGALIPQEEEEPEASQAKNHRPWLNLCQAHAEAAYPERRFPPRAGMAPAILTCPVAAMGATGNVTDPGMSEAISGRQDREQALSVSEETWEGSSAPRAGFLQAALPTNRDATENLERLSSGRIPHLTLATAAKKHQCHLGASTRDACVLCPEEAKEVSRTLNGTAKAWDKREGETPSLQTASPRRCSIFDLGDKAGPTLTLNSEPLSVSGPRQVPGASNHTAGCPGSLQPSLFQE